MRVLITGITGFVGSHMAEYALFKGAQVFGSNRWRSKTENIEHLRSKVTPVGTLELWCDELKGEHHWKLEYNVREAAE